MESSVLENSYEERNISPWPTAVKWGIIGAVFVIIVELITYLVTGRMLQAQTENMSLSTISSFLNIAVFTLFYFLAVKEYRNLLGGYISYGKGFKVAFFSAIIKGIILVAWHLIFFNFIVADFVGEMMEAQELIMEKFADMGFMDDDMIDTALENAEAGISPVWSAISGIFGTLAGGAILSLIAAAIGKRERPMS